MQNNKNQKTYFIYVHSTGEKMPVSKVQHDSFYREADTIIQLWKDHPESISDRAIARELARPQKTFSDQMKKYRTDLRRLTGDK